MGYFNYIRGEITVIHLAYPNTHRDRFVGCGRLAVLQECQIDYERINPDFTTTNATLVKAAAKILAKESSTSKLSIYEKKDDNNTDYIGNSQNLAFLLSLIHKSRPIKLKINSDIWCTGSIEMHGKDPFLGRVSKSFHLKLEAFLTDNKDYLFVVPEVNLETPEALKLLHDYNIKDANIITVNDLDKLRNNINQKTIVKVGAYELNELVRSLFRKPFSFKKWLPFITIIAVVTASIFMIGIPENISQNTKEHIFQNCEIPSGWEKNATYDLHDDMLTIVGNDKEDADSIFIGYIDLKRFNDVKHLIIKVETLNGSYNWNKVIGFSLDKQKIDNYNIAKKGHFPHPEGYTVQDNFIIGKLKPGEQLHYNISGMIHLFLGAKVYINKGIKYSFSFEIK
jgi:hypothetical protein